MEILETYSEFAKDHTWFGELNKVNQLEQRKDSLTTQMRDLFVIAQKFGLHRASNCIRDNKFFKKESDIIDRDLKAQSDDRWTSDIENKIKNSGDIELDHSTVMAK
jgi:hypothetical protein